MALERQIGELVWRHALHGRVRHRVLILRYNLVTPAVMTATKRGAQALELSEGALEHSYSIECSNTYFHGVLVGTSLENLNE